MHRVDELPLAVVLRALQLDAKLRRDVAEGAFHLGKCGASVSLRLADPEQVEIRSVENGDLHRCFNPCNQELNCSMSSAVRSAGSPEAGSSCEAPPPEVPSPSAPCEKN